MALPERTSYLAIKKHSSKSSEVGQGHVNEVIEYTLCLILGIGTQGLGPWLPIVC